MREGVRERRRVRDSQAGRESSLLLAVYDGYAICYDWRF